MSIAWLSPQIILMSLSEVRKFKFRGAGGGGGGGGSVVTLKILRSVIVKNPLNITNINFVMARSDMRWK